MVRGPGSLLGRLAKAALPPSSSSSSSSRGQDSQQQQQQQPYFSIRIVDAATGRGIPLVYLRTTYAAVYISDSAGYIAFHEPGLVAAAHDDSTTTPALWVTVASYGYASPREGFLGAAGVQLRPRAGGAVVLALARTQPAQRLYRMTGYGVYRDSVLLGERAPVRRPLLNARVAGSDSVQCARFGGRLLWLWQDTAQLAHPLGNFAMTGATTPLPPAADADRGLDFDYYTCSDGPDAFARPMVDVALAVDGSFPVWVDGLTVVPDADGEERLVARYFAADPRGGLGACVEEGLVAWHAATQTLRPLCRFRECGRGVPAPAGHAVYVRDGASGERYAYYGTNVRVRADFAHASDPACYEAFTCLAAAAAGGDEQRIERARDGSPVWRWVRGGGARPVNYDRTAAAAGLARDEAPWRLVDVDSGAAVEAAMVSVAWNPHWRLWVGVVQQRLGATTAGEIWLATARAPEGPWAHCRKVATHCMGGGDDGGPLTGASSNSNDLYNPVQHHELMAAGGRVVYFSGTFVNTFSGNAWSTPYYNYNNLMYRLDLADPRLQLPPPPAALWDTRPDE